MIQVLVAGNVPATLQIAARIPLRPVANKDGNLGRLRGASPPTKDYGAEIGRARLCRANEDRKVSGGKSLLRLRGQAAAAEDGR